MNEHPDREARDWPLHQRPKEQPVCACTDCGGVFFMASNRQPETICRYCDYSWSLAGF